MKLTVTLEPNVDEDIQTFEWDDLDLTKSEFMELDEDAQKEFMYEMVAHNIYGMITKIEVQ
jgi:hypothetical protein